MTGRQSDARPMRVICRPRSSEIKTIKKTKNRQRKSCRFFCLGRKAHSRNAKRSVRSTSGESARCAAQRENLRIFEKTDTHKAPFQNQNNNNKREKRNKKENEDEQQQHNGA